MTFLSNLLRKRINQLPWGHASIASLHHCLTIACMPRSRRGPNLWSAGARSRPWCGCGPTRNRGSGATSRKRSTRDRSRLTGIYIKRELNSSLSGNAFHYTNSWILLVKNLLCSELHCQTTFESKVLAFRNGMLIFCHSQT